MTPRVTASSLDRVFACTASAVLPQVHTTSAAADHGTGVHGFVHDVRTRAEELAAGGAVYEEALDQARAERLGALSEDAAHFTTCEAFPFELVPRGAAGEITFAWHVETGAARILGQDLGRDYSGVRDGELVGTADLVGKQEGRVVVLDWKTGKRLGAAERAWQLRFLALAAARAAGVDEAEVALVYVRADGHPVVDRATFDAIDLATFAAALRDLVARIARASSTPPAPVVGPWCKYCPAIASCPGQAGLIRQVLDRAQVEPTDEIVRARVMSLEPAQAAEAWLRMEAATAFLKRMRDALESYAIQSGGVALPDGRVLRQVESTREYLDGKLAADYLTATQPLELVQNAVELEPHVSKASIRRAFLARGQKTKDADVVIAEILRRGGGIQKTSMRVDAVEPKTPRARARKGE